jgi:hypothetical protein
MNDAFSVRPVLFSISSLSIVDDTNSLYAIFMIKSRRNKNPAWQGTTAAGLITHLQTYKKSEAGLTADLWGAGNKRRCHAQFLRPFIPAVTIVLAG